jgi:hypothetical protein
MSMPLSGRDVTQGLFKTYLHETHFAKTCQTRPDPHRHETRTECRRKYEDSLYSFRRDEIVVKTDGYQADGLGGREVLTGR